MEGVAITSPSSGFWSQRRVLLTGHTGFKGSWLSLWLRHLGAHVTGMALPPLTEPSLYELAAVDRAVESIIGDVRDPAAVAKTMDRARPDVVIHMAAQPLVRASYDDPLGTYSTNVMGTANLLDAVRRCPTVRVAVIVTTDKVYENHGTAASYRESDRLGGHDPYSSSKACAEVAALSWRRSFLETPDREVAVATARAGNVIGGGDWAADRLVPDLVRGVLSRETVKIRNPGAVRPWQHVTEPLSGYLQLAEALWNEPRRFAGPWNFGPHEGSERTVEWVVREFARLWGDDAVSIVDTTAHPYEAKELRLDISKARAELGWEPRLTVEDALAWTAEWYQGYARKESAHEMTLAQIGEYMQRAPRREIAGAPS